MIKDLYIKNFILIDELKLSFDGGFNAICGETGAGKSIIIRAIDAVLGAKVGKDVIKDPEKGALIEAVFENCHVEFDQDGVPGERELLEGEIVVSREITPNSNKFRVNGALVNLEYIKNLSENLIDIHSQHQTYAFLQKKNHINLLDNYICSIMPEFKSELEIFQSDFSKLRGVKEKIEKIEKNNSENISRAEFLKFQIDEIERAELLDGEEEKLNEELEILSNVVELKDTSYGAFWALSGDDGSILDGLSKIQVLVDKASTLDKNLNDVRESFFEGLENLRFAAETLRNYSENLSDNPSRLNEINERLSLIEKLKRKYGVLDEALEKFSAELKNIVSDTEELENLRLEAERLELTTQKSAKIISEQRRQNAKVLSKKIVEELKKLELTHADFVIQVAKTQLLTKQGTDDVEFLITTNVSKSLAPLNKIASGGELSRVMLAIKTVFVCDTASATHGTSPVLADTNKTMIFDEIDTGISGITSQAVAAAIAELSNRAAGSAQIFAITHQPIIASKAKAVYWVEKTQSATETKIDVQKLSGEKMAAALAQMASGEVTQTSLNFAQDLLKTN